MLSAKLSSCLMQVFLSQCFEVVSGLWVSWLKFIMLVAIWIPNLYHLPICITTGLSMNLLDGCPLLYRGHRIYIT